MVHARPLVHPVVMQVFYGALDPWCAPSRPRGCPMTCPTARSTEVVCAFVYEGKTTESLSQR